MTQIENHTFRFAWSDKSGKDLFRPSLEQMRHTTMERHSLNQGIHLGGPCPAMGFICPRAMQILPVPGMNMFFSDKLDETTNGYLAV